ncbi:hypothetical protein [Arthrobacter sp. M4]|uniref:hypothetical protein n=1 Tax=Arthrobacter sp. M4 TaxID=218160 RepID=UPI001CDD69F6|nr:hypothetical protein [Arthrobacter sp. M4]MCA4133837.1 hypothetical protein [Arthrobacter sp. M4]
MPLPSKAFQHWLNGVAPQESMADISRISGVKRTTLAQQMVRGKVAETTVVSISRAYGINPLDSLASFEAYSELHGPLPAPSPGELISLVSTLDMLQALIERTRPENKAAADLDDPMHPTSVKNWVDAIDDGELRTRVSDITGIAPQNFSAHLTANRMPPELALATARAAGVGPTAGLVAIGLITEAEAGWPPDARRTALNALTDGELALLAGDRLQAWGKTLRRHEQDQENTERIWENLG